jgi:hypothetical protein
MKTLIRIPQDAELPLIGLIQIGVVDRGTNLLQIRFSTMCNLNCVFCSTDSGNLSKSHAAEYILEPSYLLDGLKEIIAFKGMVHAFVDSVGEPLTHPNFLDLMSGISQLEGVESLAFETNGILLTEEMIKELAEIGVERINISIHALDDDLNKQLTGFERYDTQRIVELVRQANLSMDMMLTPVWVPGLNDQEIPKLIEFAKREIKNRKYPAIGIQKYEVHKYGRKAKGTKPVSWWKFYRALEELERRHRIELRLSPKDFGIERAATLPTVFRKGEKVGVEIKAPGWMRNEMIGVAKDRCVTLLNCNAQPGKFLKAKILRNKDNIYIAR